jgi:CRISPR-associated protein Csd2
MSKLSTKIDFALILSVRNANPNDDPLNGNRPRTDYAGLGEITDVCLKRKIRDRLMERYAVLKAANPEKSQGQDIFVQSDDRKLDDAKSLRERAESILSKEKEGPQVAAAACAKWLDVRAFGQLFAYAKKKKKKGEEADSDGVSIGIRGPLTIQSAFSIEPVSITSTQITKSVSGEGDGTKRGSDTMGMKHRVDQGIYVTFGSINPQLAERTAFSDEDAETVKALLPKLFENDASSARPEGSMEVTKVIWWKHGSKAGQYSSAKVHRSLVVAADGTYTISALPGLVPEELDGF